jgi:hypothetical protein
MMARVIATLRNLLGWAENKAHERYCPCGALSSEPVGDTVATRLVPEEYDQNREAAAPWEDNVGPADRGAL